MWLLGALLRRRLCGDLLVGKFEEVRNSEVNDLCLPDLHVPFCQIHLESSWYILALSLRFIWRFFLVADHHFLWGELAPGVGPCAVDSWVSFGLARRLGHLCPWWNGPIMAIPFPFTGIHWWTFEKNFVCSISLGSYSVFRVRGHFGNFVWFGEDLSMRILCIGGLQV